MISPEKNEKNLNRRDQMSSDPIHLQSDLVFKISSKLALSVIEIHSDISRSNIILANVATVTKNIL